MKRSYRDPGGWGASRHQDGEDITEEGPAPAPGVVHELEEGEIERQLLLRDAPVRAQPGAQQRPDALHGVDVDLAEPVAVVIARVLAPGVAPRLVPVAPVVQPGVDVVLVGVDQRAIDDRGLDHRPDRLLLHVGQHAQDDPATPLDQAEDRRLVLRQRAAARRSRQPATPPEPPPFATSAGRPLWPATTYTSSISTAPSSRAGGSPAASPCRNRSVMSCTSGWLRPNSCAICRLERFRPIRYRHSTHTRSGRWWPASTRPVRSSTRDRQSFGRKRCRCSWVSSRRWRTTVAPPHPGQRTPSGQRCCRTRA